MTPQRPCRIRYTFTAACIAFSLAVVFSISRPALAQQPAVRIVHLEAQQMSAPDEATLRSHRTEIMEAAEIYGYNLASGNWTYRQTLCAPMPNTILLHYSKRFPDGTESLFTALVPRGQGRVLIVPVLHRNATPFNPAPRNPRNYAIFNSLVPQSIAAQVLASSHNWIELSACYAEMTGADIEIPEGGSIQAGVAGAPTATIHMDSKHKSSLVTFADRESERTFRVWSISLSHAGRVTAAGTEVYPVSFPSAASQPTAVAAKAPEVAPAPMVSSQKIEAVPPSSAATTRQEAVAPDQPVMPASSASPTAAAPEQKAPTKAVAQTSESETSGPGWKFIPEAPLPPSKFIPQAPQPPSKVVPQPPSQ